MWARYEKGELLYSPIVVVSSSEQTTIYLSGQISRLLTGEVVGENDMRVQINQVCTNIQTGLAHVGATLDDVVRGVTYVTDLDLYLKNVDERYKFFRDARPANTLIPVEQLGARGCMIEIECQAIIDSHRFQFNPDHEV